MIYVHISWIICVIVLYIHLKRSIYSTSVFQIGPTEVRFGRFENN